MRSSKSGQSTTRSIPALSHADRKLLASSEVKLARSVALYEAWTRPASIREKSSRRIDQFLQAQTVTICDLEALTLRLRKDWSISANMSRNWSKH